MQNGGETEGEGSCICQDFSYERKKKKSEANKDEDEKLDFIVLSAEYNLKFFFYQKCRTNEKKIL